MPAAASAQALSCALPSTIPSPHRAGPTASEPARRIPVAAHTLALSWSPEYCRSREGDTSFQCGGSARFGFVLHGLWPDGAGSQWPQYCRPASILPPRVVRDMLCTTPSADLLQHEWAKHGTCGWSDPAAYFGAARRLYQRLRFPDMAALSRRRDLSVGEFRTLFARANPGLTASGIRVRVKNGWLDELWLCLDRTLSHARCRAGQQGGAPADQRLKIWRGRLNAR
ncbi:MAG TPA: ribonuclease T2 [Sphingobium sp.]